MHQNSFVPVSQTQVRLHEIEKHNIDFAQSFNILDQKFRRKDSMNTRRYDFDSQNESPRKSDASPTRQSLSLFPADKSNHTLKTADKFKTSKHK